MRSRPTDRPNARSAATRLLLALLLVLAPVLTFAGGMPMAGMPGDHDTAKAEHQMPCHDGVGQTADPEPQAACPHCTGDGPLSQCQCCDFAAPSGLAGIDHTPLAMPINDLPLRPGFSDPLPESPGDRRYRPPIFSS